jgi:hypothetical protein
MAPKPVIERPIMSHSNTTMAAAAERAQPQPAETAAAADFAATDARMELRTRVQSPPLLFTPDGHNAFLGDMYRGRAAFLLCGGPSLLSHDLGRLRERGVLSCAVNNAAAVFRPHLWIMVDEPANFCDGVWRDPAILKFVPLPQILKPIYRRDEAERLVPSAAAAADMPAVFGFRVNEDFVAERWLYESTVNWGNNGARVDAYGNRGSRSVMYAALRLLFVLGVRRLYLLGCDFRMQEGAANYAFPQDRSPASVRGNNYTYRVLNARLQQLRPHFEREGYQVFNCTPGSGLTVFPFLPFDEAVAEATAAFPATMNTAGMYDRAARAEVKQRGAGSSFSSASEQRGATASPPSGD